MEGGEFHPEHHKMVLLANSAGEEEWWCPVCGRRFLLQWPPEYKKTILETGDEHAYHSGGKGGLVMGAMELRPPLNDPEVDETPMFEPEPETMLPWLEWMDRVD